MAAASSSSSIEEMTDAQNASPPSPAAAQPPQPNVITQIQDNLPEIELPEMFSTRRPKNLIAGLSSGVKSFLKGTVSGAVGLVAAPTVGAKDNGFQGFIVGLANGIVSAITLPLTGAAVATVQIGRGAVNSVEAVIESNNGKDWDQEKREWYLYNLEAEAEQVRALDEFGGEGGGEGGGGEGGAGDGGGVDGGEGGSGAAEHLLAAPVMAG